MLGSGSWARTSDLIVTHNPILSYKCGLSHHPHIEDAGR